MFGFFKNILRKFESPTEEQPWPDEQNEQVEAVETEMPVPSPRPDPAVRSSNGNGHHQNGKGIEVPLSSILSSLPLELQPRVTCADVGDATISVPLEKILSQLSRGAVKIAFGDLRRAAPQVFDGAIDRDRVLVPLPLSEILPRLNPALITRRRIQKTVEVPNDISSPFDPRNKGMIFSVGPAKAEPTAPPPAAHAKETPPAPSAPLPISASVRKTISATPALQPPGTSFSTAPALKLNSRPGLPQSSNSTPAPAAPAANPAPPKTPAEPPLMVSLTSLADGWPEAVRQEIVQLNLVDAKVALPAEGVERALKQGRIAFSWKMLRSWIKPSPLPSVSAHDSAVLELPLKVVAPLFLARQNELAKGQQKLSIDENIPNLFFGFPQPEPGPAVTTPPGPKPVDTNYYVWDDSSDTVLVHESEVKRGPSPETNFVTRYATPNEIVSRAAALDGVAGALIALPDGLMVASQLEAGLNGETLAAFLPQIFGKVSQCTKELRMGELNNLNFTVGNVPWKIFRVNAIFFAAFGRTGEPLPTGQLAALAAELDHKPK